MDRKNLQLMEIEKIYGKVSPFELRNNLIKLAREESKKSARTLLDAGRGNPNWTAASPREAFFTFGQFAVQETRKVWNEEDIGGMPKKSGIAEDFRIYSRKQADLPGMDLLCKIIDYGIYKKGFDANDWIYELTDGIIGDNYPSPVRMLPHIENAVMDYLNKKIYSKTSPIKLDLFAVEGATAGMCYIFDSLIANNLLKSGDSIAIMTPIFTPYLEIPLIPRYNFNVININAMESTENSETPWQYPDSEIEKLGNTNIKALFLVNPSNPPSEAICQESMIKLVDTVKWKNPNLMIISDDVYGTFIDNFRSILSYLPFNCVGVYSFSKYFGVTGWRLGTISLAKKNVFDKLLGELPPYEKKKARKRYEALSENPENIGFIDRIAADSRQVALNHTAGLSTPQQVQMAFLSIFSLLDKQHSYGKLIRNICRRRKKLLFESLDIEFQKDPLNASYYTEFDILDLSRKFYGIKFTEYMKRNYKPVDILFSLAKSSSIVLLGGAGFRGSDWSIRISLANLRDEDYTIIGRVIKNTLNKYFKDWTKIPLKK